MTIGDNVEIVIMVCRSRRGRVRTVPSSRANSSKQSRVDPSESSGGQSKRSRSASEEPWDSSSTAAVSGQLEIRGSESQIHREAEPYSSPSHHSNSSPSHHSNRPRRLTKVSNRSCNKLEPVEKYGGFTLYLADYKFMTQFAGDKKLQINKSRIFCI